MLRLIVFILFMAGPLNAGSWSIVPEETRVAVDVSYLGGTVTLKFETVLGNILFDEKKPERAAASIVVGTRDVETGLGLLNAFVKSREYLNAARYPYIRFELDRLVQTSKSTADVFGRMTFRDVTQPVVFKAEVFRYEPMRGQRDRFDAGFNLRGAVDRRSFGQTAGYPEVGAILPIRIRLFMRSDG